MRGTQLNKNDDDDEFVVYGKWIWYMIWNMNLVPRWIDESIQKYVNQNDINPINFNFDYDVYTILCNNILHLYSILHYQYISYCEAQHNFQPPWHSSPEDLSPDTPSLEG